MRTVLLLGNYVPSLMAARVLAARGFRIVGGDGGEFSTLRFSRACHEIWTHPPVLEANEFLDALDRLLSDRPEIELILPLQERYVALLARERERLVDRAVVASPSPSAVLTCLDKERLYRVAASAGVPARTAIACSDLESLHAAAEATGYPCVIRPSGRAVGSLQDERKAIMVDGPHALASALPAWPPRHERMLVQRFVAGPRHNVYFIASGGELVAFVETRILRTNRADGTGIAVDAVTVEPRDELVSACERLVRALGYHGIGCAQFLVPPDDEPNLLEINPRHGGNSAGVEAVGLPLTISAIELAQGKALSHVRAKWTYARGHRYVWTSGDLHGLRLARRRREVDGREAVVWFRKALRTALRGDTHLTWSMRDPLPTLMVYAQWLPAGPWTLRGLGDPDR